ncbi:oxygenase MpaB family protein [Rhodococcoides navarretei]|uniref:Oxygenase MpaB family protein n=1 Tax=Rhodococcus navarretei TaxID=3128981 RepID=A0ABU9D385_9NOCA
MNRVWGRRVRQQIRALDPTEDADEIARLSVVTLNGKNRLVYALFTVAFIKQVAVPGMARILYRRGTGDIVRQTLERNDDTIVFFGQLLDHGPNSPTGREWIERLNRIHANFPIRNKDSLYTLSTLALDPHDLTLALGHSPFGPAELQAQWLFWREVAVRQHLEDIPETRAEMSAWAEQYERAEYAGSDEGRHITAALVRAFGQRCLPAPLRRWDARIIAVFCPPRLREIHSLPSPGPLVRVVARGALGAYVRTLPVQLVPVNRSLAVDFGDRRYGARVPDDVGYQRPAASDRSHGE